MNIVYENYWKPLYIPTPEYGLRNPLYIPKPEYGLRKPIYIPTPQYGLRKPRMNGFCFCMNLVHVSAHAV